jgi:DNA polymerase III sliding clamp (beta) subunit (PCNA family)
VPSSRPSSKRPWPTPRRLSKKPEPDLPEITDLLDIHFDDPELVPVILPVDARLSFKGSVEELRRVFARLTAITPTKETIPGTSFVYVSASEGVVTFTATDGAQTLILETTTLRINRDGKATLPGHRLKEVLSMAPESGIVVTVLGDKMTATSGRAVWTLSVPTGERTPAVPDVSDIELLPVPRRSLYKALNAVKRAIPRPGGRPSLEQVNLVTGSVTASDGYRLLRQRVTGFPEGLSVAIPKDTVAELLRALAAGNEENVLLGASNDLIVYKDGGETVVSRRTPLDYPDLESQLLGPALENNYRLTVDAGELRDLVKRVRVSADPEYAAVTMRFSKVKDGEWELMVLARDRTGNSASEAMFALWEGDAEPFDITLSHRYLTDLLDAYPGSLATLRVGANTKTRAAPLLLKDDERGFTGVIQQSIGR